MRNRQLRHDVLAHCIIQRRQAPVGFGIQRRALFDQVLSNGVRASMSGAVKNGFASWVGLLYISASAEHELDSFERAGFSAASVLIAITYARREKQGCIAIGGLQRGVR